MKSGFRLPVTQEVAGSNPVVPLGPDSSVGRALVENKGSAVRSALATINMALLLYTNKIGKTPTKTPSEIYFYKQLYSVIYCVSKLAMGTINPELALRIFLTISSISISKLSNSSASLLRVKPRYNNP